MRKEQKEEKTARVKAATVRALLTDVLLPEFERDVADEATSSSRRTLMGHIVRETRRWLRARGEPTQALLDAALMGCAVVRHREGAERLLEWGANPSAQHKEGVTPLHIAALEDEEGAWCALLLRHGANPNQMDRVGSLPLDAAISEGQQEAVRALLEGGAFPNGLPGCVWPPVYTAAMFGQPQTLARLLEAGATPFGTNKDGICFLGAAASAGEVECARLLLAAGVDVNAHGRKLGETALHRAVACGHLRMAQFLCDCGADVDAEDNDGETPLHQAILHTPDEDDVLRTTESLIKMLLHFGADVNHLSRVGETPLHFATVRGNFPAMIALIEGGADVEARTREGKTALEIALGQESPYAVHILVQGGADADEAELDGKPAHTHEKVKDNPNLAAALRGVELSAWPNPPVGGSGTGVAVGPHLVATAEHVIRGAEKLHVRFEDGTTAEAEVVGSVGDPVDIALLRISATRETFLPIPHDCATAPGERLLTYGYPGENGQNEGLKQAVGLLAATTGENERPCQWQHTVPAQPGNSGGPLVNAATGELIGLVTSERRVDGTQWAAKIQAIPAFFGRHGEIPSDLPAYAVPVAIRKAVRDAVCEIRAE